jgi:DNA polymerase I-like protein with 3'-5' exonuclease and polymerase domains
VILVLDFETDGIEARPDYPPTPRGLAWLAIRGSEAPERGTYFAWGHPTENNTRECYAKDVCQRLILEASRIIMHNAPFDASVLIEKWGFDLDWSKVEDTMVMAFLDNPHGELGLKPLAHECLGLPPAERDAVKDWLVRNHVCQDNSKWGAHICKAPGDLVGQYAIGDVVRTYQLFEHYQNKFEQYPGLKRAYAREMALMPHILKMDQKGVHIDIPSLEQDLNTYYHELEWLDECICEIIGPVDVDSNEDVANGIERAGLSSGFDLTPKGKRSVAKESLINAVEHPILLGHLLVRNSLATCIRTFMQPWLSQARRTGGKLFIKWNQVRNYTDTGARTGRLSSSPNLQNIPTEWEKLKSQLQAIGYELHMPMPQVRKYIIAAPGYKLISRDYQAQEMRLLAHFVGGVLLETLQKNPTTDVHLIAANIAGITRKVAKTMGFAILYGAGVGRIAETLGCSIAEAAVYKDAYLAAMPEIAELQKDLNQRGRNGEPIHTLGGRMYYCEDAKLVQGRYRTFEYKLTNYLIQGSAGDQTKQAMLDYAQSTIKGRIILSVHDEIVIECPEDAVEVEDDLLRCCMELSFKDVLECPFVTSGAVGDRFSEL